MRVTARGPAAACAFCRGELTDPARAVTCACGSVQHDDCLREHGGRCVTVGCAGRAGAVAAAPALAAGKAAGRPRLAAGLAWVAYAAGLGLGFAQPWAALVVAVVVVPLLLRSLAPGRGLASLLLLSALLEALAALSLDLTGLRWPSSFGLLDPYLQVPTLAALCALWGGAAVWLARRREPPGARAGPALAVGLSVLVACVAGARWPAVAQWCYDWRASWRANDGGPADLDALIYDVTADEGGARMATDRALRYLERPDANATFVELLRHPDKYRRHGAGVALAAHRVRDPAAIGPLVEALQGQEPLAVDAAAYALSRYAADLPDACRPAVPALVARATYGHAWVRMHCAEALGAIGDPAGVPALIELLDDDGHGLPDGTGFVAGDNWQQVHVEAREALERIGRPAVDALRIAADSHPRPKVREAAARALATITGAPRPEAEDSR